MKSKFKMFREVLGLTQQEVAMEAKTSIRAYQNYENNKRIPIATTAIRIAKALDTTVEELFSEFSVEDAE